MTRAKEYYDALNLGSKEDSLAQNVRNGLCEIAKKECLYFDKIKLPPGEMEYSPTGECAYRVFCKFKDGSLLVVLFDPYGDAAGFEAYDKASH